ncbi:MAG: hypothetical protein AB1421_00780 [Pseudomonadota bacterium]
MALVPRPASLPGSAGQWGEGVPLMKLVPKRDGQGRLYADFMMMAPEFKHRSPAEVGALLAVIQGVLARFGNRVAFADFNMKIHVLWVSLESTPGLMVQVVAALRSRVPELKLVAHHANQGGETW